MAQDRPDSRQVAESRGEVECRQNWGVCGPGPYDVFRVRIASLIRLDCEIKDIQGAGLSGLCHPVSGDRIATSAYRIDEGRGPDGPSRDLGIAGVQGGSGSTAVRPTTAQAGLDLDGGQSL